MPRCMVPGCKSQSGYTTGIKYKQWPLQDKKLSKRWFVAIRRADLNYRTYKFTPDDRVCDLHFTEDCFVTESALKAQAYGREPRVSIRDDAVPTLTRPGQFPTGKEQQAETPNTTYQKPKRQRSVERIERISRRNIVNALLGDENIPNHASASVASPTPTPKAKRRKKNARVDVVEPVEAVVTLQDQVSTPGPTKCDVASQTDCDMAFMNVVERMMLYGSVKDVFRDHTYSKGNQQEPHDDPVVSQQSQPGKTAVQLSSTDGGTQCHKQQLVCDGDRNDCDFQVGCVPTPGVSTTVMGNIKEEKGSETNDEIMDSTSSNDDFNGHDDEDPDFELPTKNCKQEQDEREQVYKEIDGGGEDADSNIEQEKLIIYERNLHDLLMKFGACPECGSKFGLVGKNRTGRRSLVKIRMVCSNHHVNEFEIPQQVNTS